MKTQVPYGKTFLLLSPLVDVECWNLTSGEKFTLQAETLIRLEHVNDYTHTTIQLMNGNNQTVGTLLQTKDGVREGYRFIVENQALSKAIGIPMPKKTPSLVSDIMAYENGTADEKTTKRLFKTLKKTGIGSKLQGHYSSRMS